MQIDVVPILVGLICFLTIDIHQLYKDNMIFKRVRKQVFVSNSAISALFGDEASIDSSHIFISQIAPSKWEVSLDRVGYILIKVSARLLGVVLYYLILTTWGLGIATTVVLAVLALNSIRATGMYRVSSGLSMFFILFIGSPLFKQKIQYYIVESSVLITTHPLAFSAAVFALFGWRATTLTSQSEREKAIHRRLSDSAPHKRKSPLNPSRSVSVTFDWIKVHESTNSFYNVLKYVQGFSGTTTVRVEVDGLDHLQQYEIWAKFRRPYVKGINKFEPVGDDMWDIEFDTSDINKIDRGFETVVGELIAISSNRKNRHTRGHQFIPAAKYNPPSSILSRILNVKEYIKFKQLSSNKVISGWESDRKTNGHRLTLWNPISEELETPRYTDDTMAILKDLQRVGEEVNIETSSECVKFEFTSPNIVPDWDKNYFSTRKLFPDVSHFKESAKQLESELSGQLPEEISHKIPYELEKLDFCVPQALFTAGIESEANPVTPDNIKPASNTAKLKLVSEHRQNLYGYYKDDAYIYVIRFCPNRAIAVQMIGSQNSFKERPLKYHIGIPIWENSSTRTLNPPMVQIVKENGDKDVVELSRLIN